MNDFLYKIKNYSALYRSSHVKKRKKERLTEKTIRYGNDRKARGHQR